VDAALRDATAARRGAPVRVAVVGGGVGGVELAAAVGARMGATADVALLTPGEDILVRSECAYIQPYIQPNIQR
jgi:NADH dehydrogenase FAD-containing subunit